jgi:hypothetical protein
MVAAPDAPARVRTAITLLWVSLAITWIQTLVDDYLSKSFAIVLVVVVLAIYGLVVFRASRRHNWARYVLLVWTIVGTVTYFATGWSVSDPWWDQISVLGSFTIEAVAIYMLFTGGVGQWYRARAAA